MECNLNFITKENLEKHVEETILKYRGNLKSWTKNDFNKNLIDPIKMLFDKTVNEFSWEEVIENEIFRQRDKSNTNAIGYFHQNIFKYFNSCTVPEYVWDVIWEPEEGIVVGEDKKIYKRAKIEMKNKHNTMNSSSTVATYAKCMGELIDDPDCVVFLVEAIAKRSQNINWIETFDSKRISNDRLRRVSIDRFYEMVTGEEDAFFQLCMVLPNIISEVFNKTEKLKNTEDTVIKELYYLVGDKSQTVSLGIALMMLGFETYKGFADEKNRIVLRYNINNPPIK
ncbi:Eco47II family restriction endonuclease [Helcococcus sueciensis]|uniref:Eco47II family restriction endonuclease n=1 Tax=Helcococcus sueciensis TaxID=241555 RepID=UPI000427447C|nr:Eco47II family restriction endonuclease [Helcococcus sueciensis]